MSEQPLLRIHLLGPMQIEYGGAPVHLPRRKVESLLAYLLLHPERHSRDHIATLLWGDTTDQRASQSLRTALATIRRLISADLLLTDREQIQLNPAIPLWTDLHHLLKLEKQLDFSNYAVAQPEFLHSHLALWQGELLAGFYDEWLNQERAHYHQRLLKLYLQVTQHLRARSEYALAITVAQRILLADPANEQAHQHLIFCYVAAGDRPAALRQYELCRQSLRDELDVLPQPETTALYQWIQRVEGEAAAPAAKVTNLPLPLSSFVGRTHESAAVKRLLTAAINSRPVRLLTLMGTGGSGKTRLAIQVATDLIDSFTHGIWWVELAALTDGALVAAAVAKTLAVNEVPGQPLAQSIATFIADRAMLLVIDNCEHLIEPCAHLAVELLGYCPHLQILATSREALNISGEILWQVPPFAVPDPAAMTEIAQGLNFDSVRLFVERAAAVQSGFTLTGENLSAIIEICRQLDGIPLAIELAAARVKMLAVAEIAAYLTGALGERFNLLSQGSRSAQARHQTLRATCDWSYALLDATERSLFRQIAIFRGGFTLDALAAIVAATISSLPAPRHNTFDLLSQLIEKSLVQVEPQARQQRYSLLETLRQYALGECDAGEFAMLQQRHARYFLHLAEAAAPALIGPQQQSWLIRLEAEHANLRTTLEYLLTQQAGEQALRLGIALARFWEIRGFVSEGRAWLQRALLLRGEVSEPLQAQALKAAGTLAWRQSDFDGARPLLEESIYFFDHSEVEEEEEGEVEIGKAEALQSLAAVNMSQGDYLLAQQRLQQSLMLCRALNYDYGVARALNYLGNLAVDQDDYTTARQYYLESLSVYQTIGDQVSIAAGFFNVGNVARQLAELDMSRTNYESALTISRSVGHRGLTGVILRNLGILALDQGDYAQARSYSEEALVILGEVGDKSNSAFALSTLGNVARALGEYPAALRYHGQKLQLLSEVGHHWGTIYALEEIATLLEEAGAHFDWIVRLLAAAHYLRQEANLAMPPAEAAQTEEQLARLRQHLGEHAFATLWDAGQKSPLAQIVAQTLTLSLA